jgi:hypothetical protein
MSDWKQDALRLWREGFAWPEITEIIQRQYFPDLPYKTVKDSKVRGYIRSLPEYKESHNTVKSSIQFKDGAITSDKLIEICENEEMTPDFLLTAHGLDSSKWTIISYRNNYWHSQVKGGKRLVMYQSKITVKPKADGISFTDIDEHFKQLDRSYKPQPIEYKRRFGGVMAEVNLADLHFGKLCWLGNTGNNFDYKIARSMFYDLLREICGELETKQLDYITFVWSNDFFNCDTIDQTTTGGTRQDVDVRWQKLFNVGVEMLVSGIDMLAHLAPVKTFYTTSNHDEVISYHAIKYLEAWFRSDNRVEINTDAKARKYQLYGKTLIGYTHGDKEKPRNLSMLMPNEARELWGQARFCELHAAHLHSEHAIEELNGVIVRRISSPTATDTWHYESGYIGAVRKAQTFIYDKERGLMQIINTPVKEAETA